MFRVYFKVLIIFLLCTSILNCSLFSNNSVRTDPNSKQTEGQEFEWNDKSSIKDGSDTSSDRLTRSDKVKLEARESRINNQISYYDLSSHTSVDRFQIDKRLPSGTTKAIPIVRVRFSQLAFFDSDSDKLEIEAEKIIQLVAKIMQQEDADTQLLLLGHTDSEGSPEHNMDLSRRRAVNVLKALRKQGVANNQMSTMAIGESQPISSNKISAGRSLNRRVEFIISDDRDANRYFVNEADFCESCLDDHTHNPQVKKDVRKPIRELEVLRLPEIDIEVEPEVDARLNANATAERPRIETYKDKPVIIKTYKE
ncbi:OmpA family protein [Maridesulfovibrio frigidus]|uniref:OmpA family protein n=1 Tax=Maridesulfovibrio frigidus TaxID=340956 RepID=UPI00068D1A0D|nr:OmpA family protein [Maridesulfovibrio frigidus]